MVVNFPPMSRNWHPSFPRSASTELIFIQMDADLTTFGNVCSVEAFRVIGVSTPAVLIQNNHAAFAASLFQFLLNHFVCSFLRCKFSILHQGNNIMRDRITDEI